MAIYNAPTGDFVTTTLNGALSAGGTSGTIGTWLAIPATNGILHLSYDSLFAVGATNGPETITYTAYNSGTGAITGLTRGVAGTTAVAHDNNSSVQSAPSALLIAGLADGTNWTTSAIKLAYASISADATTTSATVTQVAGLTATVTVPPGGRSLEITAYGYLRHSTSGEIVTMSIWDGAVASGTQIAQAAWRAAGTNQDASQQAIAFVTPVAGSKTYNVGIKISNGGTGTGSLLASATNPAFLLIKVI